LDALEASPARTRRTWSQAAKDLMLAEAKVPGANVSAVARAHDVSVHQLFRWRREAQMRSAPSRTVAGSPSELPTNFHHTCDGTTRFFMDNYATHKTAVIKNWLARRPHYHVHFTPTSASWINQVERWFAELTRKQIRRGVQTSTNQLEADIHAFIERHNENPKPYRWTKSADEILASVKRFWQKTELYVSNFRFT
jgi:transposase